MRIHPHGERQPIRGDGDIGRHIATGEMHSRRSNLSSGTAQDERNYRRRGRPLNLDWSTGPVLEEHTKMSDYATECLSRDEMNVTGTAHNIWEESDRTVRMI